MSHLKMTCLLGCAFLLLTSHECLASHRGYYERKVQPKLSRQKFKEKYGYYPYYFSDSARNRDFYFSKEKSHYAYGRRYKRAYSDW